jgi:hypothetical protein
MNHRLTNDIIRICAALNSCGVQYVIVGGTAVAFHGYYRKSINSAGETTEKPDLDIWFNPTYENYFKLLSGLEQLSIDVSNFKAETTVDPRRSFFRYAFENYTLDLIPELKSKIKFEIANSHLVIVNIDNIEIPIIGLADLITDKKINGRKKDLDDVTQLELLRKKDRK